MSHYREVCQFGYVHGQCRCPDPNKTERKIECPFTQGHSAGKPEHMVYDFHDHGTGIGPHMHHPDNGGHGSHEGVELVPSGWTPPTISRPLVVGLTGLAGSGKDTVGAEFLRRGWKRVSFAEPVYALALAIDPAVDVGHGIYERLSDVVTTVGWLDAKWNFPDVRRILQNVGNEAREIIRNDVWVSLAQDQIELDTADGFNVVLTDVRYPNEATMIRSQANGFVVKVERPDVSPINGHISEKGLSGSQIDAVLHNDGSVEDIPRKVDEILREIS